MKKTSLLTVLSTIVISVALIGSLWLNDSLGARIVNVITVITGIIGAIALFVQFKKDKMVNTASFLVDYSKSFYNDYDLFEVFSELDKCKSNPKYKLDIEKYRSKIVVYLEWIESLASLIERNIIDFYTIDNVVSYRFFLIVNNKQIQDKEILPHAQFYRGTYYLYDRWYNYELKRGLNMPLEATGLHLSKGYEEYIQKINNVIVK